MVVVPGASVVVELGLIAVVGASVVDFCFSVVVVEATVVLAGAFELADVGILVVVVRGPLEVANAVGVASVHNWSTKATTKSPRKCFMTVG